MKIRPTTKAAGITIELNRQDDQLLTKGACETVPPVRLKKILVPVDFSDFSKKALRYAKPFAELFGAEVILLHIIEPVVTPESYYFVPPGLEEANVRRTERLREKLLALRHEEIGETVPGDTVVRFGTPFNEIVKVAELEQAD